jgi:2-dehydro-3-deoxy-D-arabinonate dehydratase
MRVSKRICRFYLPDQGARVGLIEDESVHDLTASDLAPFATLTALLQASTVQPVGAQLQGIALSDLPVYAYTMLDVTPDDSGPHLLPPVDWQEVWAAGVTYAWSREARVRESKSRECYVHVYDAERPELFFKSLGEKAIGPNDWIGLRGDSRWSVPEPELALVVNPAMQIVGYTICDDVSSRDIEGENPLYLPQAKIYRHACALGPVITLADDAMDGRDLNVRSNGMAIASLRERPPPARCIAAWRSWSVSWPATTSFPTVSCYRPGPASCRATILRCMMGMRW